MLKWIAKVFQAPGGDPSHIRVLSAFVVVVVTVTWALKCLLADGWVPWTYADSAVVIGCIFGKALQRKGE